MKIIDRIFQYIEYKGIKIAEFERTCEMSNGYLGKMRIRNADIGESILSGIIENCPDIYIEWLVAGNGEMLRKNNPIAYCTNNPREGIPLIPISAMAGCFTGEDQILEYECERFVVPVFKGAEFLISVKGSSMYPKYNSGDIVACKRLPLQDLFFQWNNVYVLDTNQGPLIKRVLEGRDENHILIVSENEKYKPFELHRSQLNAIAIVLGVIRLE